MSLIEFPFIPDKVQFEKVSDFLPESVKNELYRENRFNKLRDFSGNKKAYGTQVRAKQTVSSKELKDFLSYYFLLKGKNNYFTLPESFWRNINNDALINELPNLGLYWVFTNKPSIKTVVSGIYELSYLLETVAEDSIVNKDSFDKTLAPGSGGRVRFGAPTLSPEIASRLIKTVPISAKFEITAPLFDFAQGSNPSTSPSILFSAPTLTSLAIKESTITSPSFSLGAPSLSPQSGQKCFEWYYGSEEFKAICLFSSGTLQIPEHFGKWLDFDTTGGDYSYILSATPEEGFHVHLINSGTNDLFVIENGSQPVEFIGEDKIPPDGKALLVYKGDDTWVVANYGSSSGGSSNFSINWFEKSAGGSVALNDGDRVIADSEGTAQDLQLPSLPGDNNSVLVYGKSEGSQVSSSKLSNSPVTIKEGTTYRFIYEPNEDIWLLAEFSILYVADGTKTLPDSTPYLSINETDKEIAVNQPSDEELPQLAANDRDLAVTSRWRSKPVVLDTNTLNPNLGMSFVCSDSSLTAIAIDIGQTYADGQVFELELTNGSQIDQSTGGFNFGNGLPPSGNAIISCRYSEALGRWLCSGAGGY